MAPPRIRINVGCGKTPTPGWLNYDNSPSVLLSKKPLVLWFLKLAGLISPEQQELVDIARKCSVEYVDIRKGLPNRDGSVSAIYSCHMLEHLDVPEAKRFLSEAYRALEPRGLLRLVVPDLRKLIHAYLADENADRLVANSLLATVRPGSWRERFKYIVVGPRHHLWMYDARSLAGALTQAGYVDVHPQDFGSTRIPDPGTLDLSERADDSICVEAARP